MSIEVRWCDQSRAIIHWKVEGGWRLEEFYDSWACVKSMADDASRSVTMLVDLYKSADAPNISILPHFRNVLSVPHIERVVVVRRSGRAARLVESIANILLRMRTCCIPPVSYADTLHDACALIHHRM